MASAQWWVAVVAVVAMGCGGDPDEVEVDAGPAVTVQCEQFPTTIDATTGIGPTVSLCFNDCTATTDNCDPMDEALIFGTEANGFVRKGTFTELLDTTQGTIAGLVVTNLAPNLQTSVDFMFTPNAKTYRVTFSYEGDSWTFVSLVELTE